MINQYEKYLPIGSVVLLKNGTKRMMITGYASIDMKNKDKVYDYMGCLYPEGVITTNESLLFDHDNIEKVFCVGYQDEEQKEFIAKLKELLTEDTIKDMLEKARSTDFKQEA